MRPRCSWNANVSSSFVAEHVSGVPSCFGTSRCDTTSLPSFCGRRASRQRGLDGQLRGGKRRTERTCVPSSKPHVSMLSAVLCAATTCMKCEMRREGKTTGRRGTPASLQAVEGALEAASASTPTSGSSCRSRSGRRGQRYARDTDAPIGSATILDPSAPRPARTSPCSRTANAAKLCPSAPMPPRPPPKDDAGAGEGDDGAGEGAEGAGAPTRLSCLGRTNGSGVGVVAGGAEGPGGAACEGGGGAEGGRGARGARNGTR